MRVGAAMRDAIRDGYTVRDLRADLLAGVVVGIVALPLSMALAIASGVPPQHGLYTAVVAGAVIALLGGSRVQVSGPTAAFVVVLAPISARFGLEGLLLATSLAGLLLIAFGMLRLGRLIEFIPHPVTTGFTAGIAVVIATLQVRDFLGLRVEHMPDRYPERVVALARALPTAHWPDMLVGAVTLALLLLMPRVTRRVPAPLVALPAGAALGALLPALGAPGVVTIAGRFSYMLDGVTHAGIPPLPPLPVLPWLVQDAAHPALVLSVDVAQQLLGAAFAIAMLGAIESLLSAVIADGMTGSRHDPDAELVAQGVGNLVAPFFGGFAATGALARTATNIRSGARSPVAALTHAIFVLVSILALAPLLGHLPMAGMAALLLVVARNMAELKHVAFVLRHAPRSDALVLLVCFVLTVVFDMVVAVTAGVVLASMLFMGRMAEISGARVIADDHPALAQPMPAGVLVYAIGGPLFFGAAQKAMGALRSVGEHVRVVVLDLSGVPAMDATGLVSLESTVARLASRDVFVVLAGVQAQPMHVLERAGWHTGRTDLAVCGTLEAGLEVARAWVESVHAAPAA